MRICFLSPEISLVVRKDIGQEEGVACHWNFRSLVKGIVYIDWAGTWD